MTATTLAFTSSVKCGSCDQKVERKYYITEYHDPMCLSCAGKYYKDSDILKNKYFQKTDNSLKTVLLICEGLIFVVLIVCVNFRRKKPVKQTENGYTSGVDNKIRSVITRESSEYPKRERIRKSVKETVKEPVKETVKKTAKEPAKETIKKTAKESAKETIKKTVKEPAKETAKKPAGKNTDSLKKTKDSFKEKGDSKQAAKKKSSDVPATKSLAKSSVSANRRNQKKESETKK